MEIANRYEARIETETSGLGHARQLCLDVAETAYIIFVDSDVEILRKDFLRLSVGALESSEYGAVVGLSVGHRFAYGLPASLLVLRRRDFRGKIIPDYIDARETFFLQKRLNELGLKTFYVYNAMRHSSKYREFKPEWEGANTRLLPSSPLIELGFTSRVMLLLTLNNFSFKNFVYLPIFYLKFLRGFAHPELWIRLNRLKGGEGD